jgi:predicted AlkP superfamily phosphohydrolase/phosphomutase
VRETLAALLILALLGCSAESASCAEDAAEPAARKVMLIGIDGLEWDIMGPMVEAGRLPHFAKLVNEGTWGEVQSLQELGSPMIWTSIATGKLPAKHGILDFATRPAPADTVGALLTSNSRRVKTVWQILGDSGRTVGITNWLVTWPAEPVNGYLVSDYFGHDYQWDQALGVTERMTFPPRLALELASLRLRTDDISDDEASRFVGGAVKGDAALALKLRTLKTTIAADETARAVGLHLAATRPVDFFGIYLKGIDSSSHYFWTDMRPDSGPPVDPSEVQAFGETVTRYYEYMDGILGQFLDLAGGGWTVIVTSDHGFSGPAPRGTTFAAGTAMHDPTGVLILFGKDIVRGRKLSSPSVLDITPTLLALYGLPVADDMDGKVLVGAIDPAFLSTHPVQRTETYETAETKQAESEAPAKSPIDDEVRERLRSLGYLK